MSKIAQENFLIAKPLFASILGMKLPSPDHVGVERNEKADTQVRKGTLTPFMGHNPFCGLGDLVYHEVFRKEKVDRRETL